MEYQRRSIFEYSVKDLDKELIARGAQMPVKKPAAFSDGSKNPEPENIMADVEEFYDAYKSLSPNEALSHISTDDLVKILLFKTGQIEIDGVRGVDGKDQRMDCYDITDEEVRKNTGCTAAVCSRYNLIDTDKEFSILKVRKYREVHNLSTKEAFHDQPTSAGLMFTGFLVEEDIVATAGHCEKKFNATDLRVVFGYKMADSSTPVIRIPNDNIYKGVEFVRHSYDRKCIGSDWALVKLDRKVVGQEPAALAKQDIFCDQPVYVMGYPCGLPLKYAPGAKIHDVEETHFGADLDIYCGSSGSPVFDSLTHEVVGMVVKGHSRDFRRTPDGFVSVIYTKSDIDFKRAQCIRVSQFSDIVVRK